MKGSVTPFPADPRTGADGALKTGCGLGARGAGPGGNRALLAALLK